MAVHYLVQNKTGLKINWNRIGPSVFGPVHGLDFFHVRSSVWSWIEWIGRSDRDRIKSSFENFAFMTRNFLKVNEMNARHGKKTIEPVHNRFGLGFSGPNGLDRL